MSEPPPRTRPRRGRALRAPQPSRPLQPAAPDVWQTVQERQRALLQLLVRRGSPTCRRLRLTEVGCGAGGNLLELLRLGFAPCAPARPRTAARAPCRRRAQVLPRALPLWLGDASRLAIARPARTWCCSPPSSRRCWTMPFQQRLAAAMWRWVKPGGGVLWYDFTVDNPRNPDVRGVPLARVRQLFPQARVTLAARDPGPVTGCWRRRWRAGAGEAGAAACIRINASTIMYGRPASNTAGRALACCSHRPPLLAWVGKPARSTCWSRCSTPGTITG
jgi:SAM-dependent methyltransferase